MGEKFKFDTENLDFQTGNKRAKIVKIILSQFVAIVFLGFAIFFAYSYFVDTPLEKNLKHQNEIIKQEFDRITVIYAQNEKNLQTLEKQDDGLYQIMFGKEKPVNHALEIIGKIENVNPKVLTKQNNQNLIELTHHLQDSKDSFNELLLLLENAENIDNIPTIQPVPNPNLDLLLYGFGERLDPIYHTPDFHSGIDYGAPIGTPVFATANGVVSFAGRGKREQGIIIEINHGDYTTAYHHLESVDTRNGKSVEKGELIGYVGTSGKSLIPHLHYEIRYNGIPLNPIFFMFLELSSAEYRKLYEKSIQAGISLD